MSPFTRPSMFHSPVSSQVQDASDAELLNWVAQIAHKAKLDENMGDASETRQSILWIATRGKRGKHWGHLGWVRP
jgi:hypothetical protein